MKSIIVTVIFMFSIALSQGTEMSLYDYQIQVNANVKTKNGKIGFATMKPMKNPKDVTTFGYWLSNTTNANAQFFELKNGQNTVAKVTAKDFAAKAKIQTTGAVTTSSYSTGSGSNALTLSIESTTITDITMPLGKVIQVSVKVKTSGKKSLSGTLSLYADGFVRAIGTNGLSASNVENGKPVYPFVLLIADAASTVGIETVQQKTAGNTVTLRSSQIPSNGGEVVLMSMKVHGTTVKSVEKSEQQAVNVETMVSNKKEVTELALMNSASNATPFPGDTVTYTIVYHNIGTALAQDVTISNPIPANTDYVNGSADGDGAEISLERKTVPAPQQGPVTSVSWKITKKVMPGEEGKVTMKAIVR